MRYLNRGVLPQTAVFIVALLLAAAPGVSAAGARSCTYGEARMALEDGNAVRGLALMRMASRDGDPRADKFLRDQDYVAERPMVFAVTGLLKTASVSRK